MRRRKSLFAGLVVAIAALVAGTYLGFVARAPETSLPVVSGAAIARLFATRLVDANGKVQALSQWQGKTLVVNFWASWCPPCREEMPYFSRLQTKYSANGVQFVGIALDTADNVISFSKQQAVSYPLLIADSEGAELIRDLGNSRLALPYTVVLGPGGEAQLARLGRIFEQELDTLLPKIVRR
ncbi:TlpA disulfide reductase family protein [Propionivibrio sp.]|uniref:TlpA family protein disulfide reductase n=1 Tax=Propionivibrio sp. TaxID=2212460 RepID=UPI00263530C7|nr:TlpA disulfide reductase family protein [Propionivibrio sp.]